MLLSSDLVFRTWYIILNFLRSSYCQGLNADNWTFPVWLARCAHFFGSFFFLSISLSFSLIHTHGGTAYTFKVSFATFLCKGAYILRVYSFLTKNNPKTLYLANKNIFQKSFHVIRTILLDVIFGRKFVLLVQNRAFFLILPVKKVNNNKFSFQNFVLSSQNNIQDNMNKFKNFTLIFSAHNNEIIVTSL